MADFDLRKTSTSSCESPRLPASLVFLEVHRTTVDFSQYRMELRSLVLPEASSARTRWRLRAWLVGTLTFLVFSSDLLGQNRQELLLLKGDEYLRSGDGGTTRDLLFREPYGTIYLDYYRTYSTWNLLWFEWKFHSINKVQIHGQIAGLNYWYDGRVRFKLGAVFDYDDAPNENVDGLPALYAFASDIDQRNLGRISILAVKSYSANTGAYGAATLDIPFGGGTQLVPTLGTIRVAPAVTFANDAPSSPDTPLLNLLSYAAIGFGNLSGALLAHEIGHVLGFRHTASFLAVPRESVERYRKCDLDLRYPSFDLQNLDDSEVTGTVFDGTTPGGVTTTYQHGDWMGRTNIMSGVRVDVLVPALLKKDFGVYKFGYEGIFEQITECWFELSSAYENSRIQPNE